MEFRIADTFTESLARLSGEEQKAVKITAYDLQIDPSQPGLQFHKLEKARDKSFWSIRVSSDIRLIVHRTAASLLLCYAGHHDQAYQWAERRKIETHPKTGAAQLVEIRELTREVVVPRYVEEHAKPFEHYPESELLAYGIPREWLDAVRQVATEDEALELAGHLPAEAAEAVLNIAAGQPAMRFPAANAESAPDPFEHPDAQRRFRTIKSEEDLRLALDFPWEKWAIFLHPSQRQLVEKRFNGPARVTGSAGTGKTIVALHRAVHLARTHPGARVLLTTFSDVLAQALRHKLRLLLAGEPRLGEQIEVAALDAVGGRLFERVWGAPRAADQAAVQRLLSEAAAAAGERPFSQRFLEAEWAQVVDAWQLRTWEAYRDVNRLGRRTRLPEAARQRLWAIFSRVLSGLEAGGLVTPHEIFTRLAAHYATENSSPYDFAVVDEAQDVSIAQLKFLASIAGSRPDGLFFAGDLGQRIFQQPFSWRALGIEISGRSSTLRINYRTSRQIRQQADRLLGPDVTDVDGNREGRETISLFEGAPPGIAIGESESAESEQVAAWLRTQVAAGVPAHEIAVFVRSEAQLPRAQAAIAAAGLQCAPLDAATVPGGVGLATMHLAKGLEFRSVAVMACDDEVIPLQERIAAATDPSDLDEVYNTERHLLYVACTRARDHLLVSAAAPASEFLDDLRAQCR